MSLAKTRPLRADAARNRAQLLDAAREAFGNYGVTASLDDVARAANVGPGTLYRHFPTRDDLVLAVIDEGLADLHRLGTTLLGEPDALDALRRWLRAYIDQGSTFDGLARTLAYPPPAAGASGACHLAREAGAGLVRRAIDEGLVRDDVDIRDVLDLAAAIAWLGEQPDRSADQRLRLLEVIVDGLRVPRSSISKRETR
ncbi:TetR/AcrR family transcriptional regulator [Mycobacterium sp. Marseille-P9652]|uniref:TetR/AcrR family transcriptional regulator n=1 Tax=Mycobacterium sp. Marseille-P9652 TaxID=2654950 RepID=UPI001E39316E|nr:TetR/AcrR family transcriptional regulator [Mycobacterium sp. Marseille-P9652]